MQRFSVTCLVLMYSAPYVDIFLERIPLASLDIQGSTIGTSDSTRAESTRALHSGPEIWVAAIRIVDFLRCFAWISQTYGMCMNPPPFIY